jgi:hypothetical protein
VAGRWFSQQTLISSTNKTDRNDITKIVLKVALSTKIKIQKIRKLNNLKRLSLTNEPKSCSSFFSHAVLVIGLYELLDPTT